MNTATIIVIAILVVCVALALYSLVRQKLKQAKQGNVWGCSCGCQRAVQRTSNSCAGTSEHTCAACTHAGDVLDVSAQGCATCQGLDTSCSAEDSR